MAAGLTTKHLALLLYKSFSEYPCSKEKVGVVKVFMDISKLCSKELESIYIPISNLYGTSFHSLQIRYVTYFDR